ncbi:MAG: ABC transporter substrate-binding protein [Bacteroidetes bacterium]|nr:ABC transporter substrate-binding protein [Bacteroidota bacterium]
MKKILLIVVVLSGFLNHPVHAQDNLKQMRSSRIEKIDGKDYYIHTVKKGQTLYMIAKAYEVDINDVIAENPVVKEGLKTGQKIRILVPAKTEPPRKQPRGVPDEIKPAAKPGSEEFPPCGKDRASMKSSYNIALMIPLFLNEVEQMDLTPDPDASSQDNRPLQFVQFYEGFRIALDSLKEAGVSVKVTVYDAERDTLKTLKLIQDPELKNMDLIIGMMYHRNFQIVADFAEKNNIPIVNPISERDQIVEKHKKVFKVRPSMKTQFSELIQYIQTGFADSNIVVVSDNQRINKTMANNILDVMTGKKADVHLADGYGEVLGLLSAKKGNLIVMISDNKSYVLDVVTKLNEHRNEFGVTLLGLPRWDRFDDLEADYLVNLKTHVMAAYFIDYDDPAVKKFVSVFQDRYKTDPDPLAFQGFDVTFYFISALWKYGKSFDRCIADLRMKSLQTDLRFASTKDNGFENQYWEMYEYDAYRLKRIVLK